jgi:sodium/bile acid cotransporter 7
MKKLLIKWWFLILLLGSVALAFLRPHWLRPVTHHLDPRAVVSLALFLMAWSLESRSLFRSLLRPLPALVAVLVSYGVLPALGWLAGQLLPEDDLRIGLLLIVSVPCTLASAVLWTRMAGGNEATALLVILATTATSWLATTTWLAFATGTTVRLDVPGMMQGLALVLILPVGLGQFGRAWPPLARCASRHKPVLSVIARLLVLLIILKAAVDVTDKLVGSSIPLAVGSLVLTLVLCLGTHLAALLCGLWGSRLLRCDRASQIAVAFAGSQKTLPVALYLFDAYFVTTYPLAVAPLVCYHVGQLVVDTLIAERLVAKSQPLPEELLT